MVSSASRGSRRATKAVASRGEKVLNGLRVRGVHGHGRRLAMTAARAATRRQWYVRGWDPAKEAGGWGGSGGGGGGGRGGEGGGGGGGKRGGTKGGWGGG